MTIFEILEGIISSVPEAVALYHKVVPLISQRADISPDQIAEVTALVPAAHAAVETAHQAIATLIDTHATD